MKYYLTAATCLAGAYIIYSIYLIVPQMGFAIAFLGGAAIALLAPLVYESLQEK